MVLVCIGMVVFGMYSAYHFLELITTEPELYEAFGMNLVWTSLIVVLIGLLCTWCAVREITEAREDGKLMEQTGYYDQVVYAGVAEQLERLYDMGPVSAAHTLAKNLVADTWENKSRRRSDIELGTQHLAEMSARDAAKQGGKA